MIIFIDLTDQIWDVEMYPDRRDLFEFGFFDTVISQMVTCGPENVWSSWKEFEEAYCRAYPRSGIDLERFRKLFGGRNDEDCSVH